MKIEKTIAEHTRKADQIQEMISELVENVFSVFERVSRNKIQPFQTKLKNFQQQLSVASELGKKSAAIIPILQPLESVIKGMTDFTQKANDITGLLKGSILDVFPKILDFTNSFESKLKPYAETVTKVFEEIKNLVNKVTEFLNTVQLRQKGLDIQDYKPWNQYQHCSAEVCLRLMRRSSALYLNSIFVFKYPHLDDLSSKSLSNTGRWPVPGLFDDYKVRGIAQLSGDEMLLGMRGVASNIQKPSLLVVVDIRSTNGDILKVLQLKKDGQSFLGDMGGIAVVKSELIWISSDDSLYSVRVSDLRNSMSSKQPSTIDIRSTKPLGYQVVSISYDDSDSEIWVLQSNKAISYGVSGFGDIHLEKNSVSTEEQVRGFTIVRQYGIKYACLAKCSLVVGYQCRLEFHEIDAGTLGESTILRVVRTPMGLEAVQTVGTEHIVAAFSSGTFSEKEKIQRIAGDFEDRYFKLNVPVLKTEFSITENCLYFKVGWDDIIPRKRLFPFGDMKCGTRRKRRALEKVLDRDVYTEALEKHRRSKRVATEEVACFTKELTPFTGNYILLVVRFKHITGTNVGH